MEQRGGNDSILKDMLLNASPNAIKGLIAVLAMMAAGSLSMFAYSEVSGELIEIRDIAGTILTISLPLLVVAVGVISAASGSTERIDQLVSEFLHKTIPGKIGAYIDFSKEQKTLFHEVPFDRVVNVTTDIDRAPSAKKISFCAYRLHEREGQGKGRKFEVLVKMNVFNFELQCPIRLDRNSVAGEYESILIDNIKDLENENLPPFVRAVVGTLHGALREGYAVSVIVNPGKTNEDDLVVSFGFRQKLVENFLGSPYLRRYFAEDAAIAIMAFYNELLGSKLKDAVKGGEFA